MGRVKRGLIRGLDWATRPAEPVLTVFFDNTERINKVLSIALPLIIILGAPIMFRACGVV